MAATNHERVGKAMELLREGLAPFVEREVGVKMEAGAVRREAVRRFADQRLANKPIGEWDVAGLLKLMCDTDTWNNVFRERLGFSGRNLVFELRDWRNKWAHQERLVNDDADRALDSAQRLLAAIDAPQADAVACIKRELRRLELADESAERAKEEEPKQAQVRTSSGTALPGRHAGTPPADGSTMDVTFGDMVFWAAQDAQINRDLRTAGRKFTEEVLDLCVDEPTLGRREAVTRIAIARGVSLKAALGLRLPAIQRCVDAVRERSRSQG